MCCCRHIVYSEIFAVDLISRANGMWWGFSCRSNCSRVLRSLVCSCVAFFLSLITKIGYCQACKNYLVVDGLVFVLLIKIQLMIFSLLSFPFGTVVNLIVPSCSNL